MEPHTADQPDRQPEYREYLAWDVPTRLFHWINALAVLGLIATGVGILTGSLLGLSPEGKIALKSVHIVFGYVMALNLLWRFAWAFFGNRYALALDFAWGSRLRRSVEGLRRVVPNW